AAPYSLNHGRCGHAFCGTCLLKWLFAAFSREFRHWMEQLRCPLCHAVLPSIPRSTPREISTFPFVPNRSTEEVIKSYITVLKNIADNHGPNQGTEEVCGEVKEWAEGKPSRIDWERREYYGRTWMEELFERWPLLQADGFIFRKSLVEIRL
ncbi:hypothetical protein L226DRAFT_467971, partial [Lentinus tigrinus ALCF2SS1-7]